MGKFISSDELPPISLISLSLTPSNSQPWSQSPSSYTPVAKLTDSEVRFIGLCSEFVTPLLVSSDCHPYFGGRFLHLLNNTCLSVDTVKIPFGLPVVTPENFIHCPYSTESIKDSKFSCAKVSDLMSPDSDNG